MRLTFLGSGTSYGVPYVGCGCAVCRSSSPLNKRMRASILVETETTRILIDTTPDLRTQLLRSGVSFLSGVLWTHSHNDHIIGLDDIRPISDRCGYINGYARSDTAAHLRQVFPYIFEQGRSHGGFPRVTLHELQPDEPFTLGDIRVTAVPICHGRREIFAYRLEGDGKTLVYATDCSGIPPSSRAPMRDADLLVLDALRYDEHPTHFSVAQALEAAADLRAKFTYFTHIAHDLDHDTANAALPLGVQLAYDGLRLEVN